MKLLPFFLILSVGVLAQDNVGRFVPAHTDDITCITYSPNGKFIVSGGWDNEINIISNDHENRLVQTLSGYQGAVKSLAFSRDGYNLIAGGQDGKLSFYNVDLEYGRVQTDTVYNINDVQINKLVYGPGMKSFFSAGDDGTFTMYDLQRDDTKKVYTKRPISAAAVAIDRRSYFLANEGKADIVQYDVFGNKMRTLTGHKGDITDLMVTVDRKYLISSSEDKTIRIWQIERGKLEHTFKNHEWAITDIDVDLFGKYMVSCGLDGTVNLFDLKSKKVVWTKKYTGKKIQAVALSPDLTNLAIAIHSDDVNATGYYIEETKLKARNIKLPKKAVITKKPKFKPKATVANTGKNNTTTKAKEEEKEEVRKDASNTPKPKEDEKEAVDWDDQIEITITDE